MSLPSSEPFKPMEEPESPATYRRRRARPVLRNVPEDQRDHLESITNLITPSIDFFVGFLLAGLLAGVAMLLDAPALYILAALFTPFLGPVIGVPFSAVIGSGRVLISSLINLTLGGGLVFGLGALSGWLSKNILAANRFSQIRFHNIFNWTDLAVLVVGAGFTTFLLVRSPRQKPLVANVALAYELVLPLAVGGFCLTNPISGAWTNALDVFMVHLVIAVATAAVLLFILKLRPQTFFGFALSTTFIALTVLAVWGMTGIGSLRQTPQEALPPPQPTATQSTPTILAGTATLQSNQTPQPAVATITTTYTLVPTHTATPTVTFAPTPVWAKIDAPSGGGALIREEPGGKIVTSLVNGSPVTIISEPIRIQGGAIWVKVRTEDGDVGWILQSLLTTATPSPGW